jgi:hypothetical protein
MAQATAFSLQVRPFPRKFTLADRFKAGSLWIGKNGCHADRWHGCRRLRQFRME